MELFRDRARVRLQSIVRGTFLRADEDGRRVSLTERQNSLNTEWLVHRVRGDDGNNYVLLYSAAYGRYLAVSPFGHRGRAAVQRAYDAPQQADIFWEGVDIRDNVVLMRHVCGDLLRANGRYLWYDGVSVDDANNLSAMMHWKVESIPARPVAAPPALPGGPLPVDPVLWRTIRYLQVNGQEEFNDLAWSTIWFNGRSMFLLKADLAKELGEKNFHNISLCVRAGSQGRLTPLVTDLPADEQSMDIVVFNIGSEDRFPRQSGFISHMPGWKVLLGHAGPSDLLISAKPARSKTVLHIRLWTGRFTFSKLLIKMADDGMCSVQFRHSHTLLTRLLSLPYDSCVLLVPVPDFDCIFKAVGVRMELVQGPCETTFFTGPRFFRGSYTDANWSVRFMEMATPHGPVLLLSFRSSGLNTFGAQLLVWPAFHRLRITRDLRRPDACNIHFQGTEGSRVQFVPDVRPAVRMIPLPFLSKIWDAFTTGI